MDWIDLERERRRQARAQTASVLDRDPWRVAALLLRAAHGTPGRIWIKHRAVEATLAREYRSMARCARCGRPGAVGEARVRLTVWGERERCYHIACAIRVARDTVAPPT